MVDIGSVRWIKSARLLFSQDDQHSAVNTKLKAREHSCCPGHTNRRLEVTHFRNRSSEKIAMTAARPLRHYFKVAAIVSLVLLLLPLIPVLLGAYALYCAMLYGALWIWWCLRGINVLLVYSDSPNWQEYIEANIIPKLPPSSVKLNWSERKQWREMSLPVLAFRHFGGSREFNPLVVVLQPFRRAKIFRFWQAFQDHKHGKAQSLTQVENELFRHLGESGFVADARSEGNHETDETHE